MPAISTYSPTSDQYLDGLLSGVKWDASSLTYSFPTNGSFYGPSGYSTIDEHLTGFAVFHSAQQTAVRAALQNIAQVSNLTFAEVTESSTVHGDLRYARSNAGGGGGQPYSRLPETADRGGDTWFRDNTGLYDNPLKGNNPWMTMLHETGHALGLTHPHDTVIGFFAGFNSAMPLDKDILDYTVMSRNSYENSWQQYGSYVTNQNDFPQTLMMYDILALQTLYGAKFTTNSSDTTYTWSPTTGEMSINGTGQGAPVANRIYMTLWDGDGQDTYDFSNYATNLNVNLQPGAWTQVGSTSNQRAYHTGGNYAAGNIANALQYQGDARSLIENAIGGSGNDTIVGNNAVNLITGGAGNDTIDGGASNQDVAIFSGSRADYTVSVDTGGDILVSSTAEGADRLHNVEQLRFDEGTYTWDPVFSTLLPPRAFQLLIVTNKVTIGGNGHISGTNDPDDVTLLYGSISLDGSFNRGGDIVRMEGNASTHSIARAGSSTAIITNNDDLQVAIPLGTVGLITAFDDGKRTLLYDGAYKIGTQSFGTTGASITAASEGTAAPITGVANVQDVLIMTGAALQPGQTAHVTIGGKVGITGTNGIDVIAIADVGGTFVFDGSFNLGGDIIVLSGDGASYTATRQGSSTMVIATTDEQLTIPIGTVGLTLRFADGDRTLVYQDGEYLVGSQEIIGTSANQLDSFAFG